MNHLVFKNVANKAIQQQFQNIANEKLIRNSLEIWNYIKMLMMGYTPSDTSITCADPHKIPRKTLGYVNHFIRDNGNLTESKIILNPSLVNNIILCDSTPEQIVKLINLTKVILHESTHAEDFISTQHRINLNSLRLASSFVSIHSNLNNESYYENNYSVTFVEASANIGANAKTYSILKNFVLPSVQNNPELNNLILSQMQICKSQVRKYALKSIQNTLLSSDSSGRLKDINDSTLTDSVIAKQPNFVDIFPVLQCGYHKDGKPFNLEDLAFQKSIHYFDKVNNFINIYNTLIFQRTARSLIDNPNEILSLSLSDRNLVRESIKEYGLTFKNLSSKFLYLLESDSHDQLQKEILDDTKIASENNFIYLSLRQNVEESISQINEIQNAFDIKTGSSSECTNAI